MKDRLKQVRKNSQYGKSQQAFADYLGIPFSNLASYESGRRVPSNAVLQLICEKCNVNYDWLKTGEGFMDSPMSRDEEIADIAAKVINTDDAFRQKLVGLIMQMDESQMEALKKMAIALAEEAKK